MLHKKDGVERRFARVRRRTCASGTAVCLALAGMTPPLANRVGAALRALSAARSALRRPPSAARATGARTRAWLLPGAEKFPRPVAAAKRIAADAMLTCVSTRPNGAPPNGAFKKRARTKLRTSQRAREGVSARSTATIANGILESERFPRFSRKADTIFCAERITRRSRV